MRAFGVDVDEGGGTGFETCTVDCQAAASGDPAGIGVTSSGEVYVGDSDEDYVGRISSAGAYLGSFAGEGSGAGTVVNPQSIDVGAGDEILVTQSADTSLDLPVLRRARVPRVVRSRAGVPGRSHGRRVRSRRRRRTSRSGAATAWCATGSARRRSCRRW